jgi:CDP-4-dehydro-6-deoxyglucose reductase, E1
MTDPAILRQEILRLTREYSRQVHAGFRPAADPDRKPWEEGTTIPYAGRVFTEHEVEAAVSSTLDFWLTLGKEGEAFQQELAAFLGVRHSLLVNSGSSANLVAISALTSAKLPEARRIKPGDEVITVAAGFPTTVAPIVQVGAVPVFIDADPITGNARCDQLEAAYSAGKTKAVMMAHALGNPFDLAVPWPSARSTTCGWWRTTATPWVAATRCHGSWPRAWASARTALASMKGRIG